MPNKRPGSELFIVDNADDDWKVHHYLHDWCEIARAFDDEQVQQAYLLPGRAGLSRHVAAQTQLLL